MGVTAGLRDFAPEIRFTAGRLFTSGLRELIASNACNRQFLGFELGDRRVLRGGDWTIVGHFDLGAAQDCVDALIARLGERLGWNVELRSAPGAGTTATIRFAG